MKVAEDISIYMTKDDFQLYLEKVKEKISSSISQLHFDHYNTVALTSTSVNHMQYFYTYSENWVSH